MKNKKFVSIRTKLIVALVFSAAMALFLSTIAISLYAFQTEKENGIQSLSQMTKMMGSNLSATVEFDDSDNANMILSSLKLDENIESAFLFKEDRSVFASYNEQNNLKKLALQSYKTDDIKKYNKYIDFNYMIVSSPIFFEDKYLATFSIVSNTNKLRERIIEQFFLLLIVFFASITLVILSAFKIQKIFTSPILEMKDAMLRISRNDYENVHMQAKENDEFRILFDGFNNMIKTIQDRTLQMEYAKKEIEDINKHTRESIEYAALIQSALIPDNDVMRKYFKEQFILWQPKDVVGGDIYLFEELRDDNECLLMVIDCTGHGVPGAFVTMLVKAIERQIIGKIKSSQKDVSPAEILSIFNIRMKQLLKQDGDPSISNAGFDGQVMYYNKKDKILKFASARNEIIYYQDDELKIIKGDRHSIGYKHSDKKFEFSEHTVDVSKETTVYLCSDGYWDQNGGEKDLPFGKKRLKRMLAEIHKESMADQQEEFIYTFEDYKGDGVVSDDVTVVGFKI